MKFSAYIATSVDGYIATLDGGVDWLHNAGNNEADMSANPDMGFNDYVSSVDCMVMGRKCMQAIANFNLTPEQWPYGAIKIYVLSHSLKTLPEGIAQLGNIELYDGDIQTLANTLFQSGFKHAYVDGGSTITSFIKLGLLDEITITKAPILLGAGIPLFGELNSAINLIQASSTAFANDFIQEKYVLDY